MGRASKARAHDKKMRAKRAAKASRRALYASMVGTSRKGKKVRARNRAGVSAYKHMHLVTNCGNIGCSQCYPEYRRTIWNGRVISI